MSKRLLALSLLLLIPTAALADSGAGSGIQSPNSAASQLGPQASTPSASSDGASGLLQPVDGSTLQSNGTNALGGSGDSASSTLQDPATAGQNLQVLSDNADGTTHAPGSQPVWGWLALVAGLLAITGGASYLLYRANRTVVDDGEVAAMDPPEVMADELPADTQVAAEEEVDTTEPPPSTADEVPETSAPPSNPD